jgi:hypothetical protein
VGTDYLQHKEIIMSDTYIVSSRQFEQFKQRARKLKQLEHISHHEALERVAQAAKFNNWHEVTIAARDTQPAETAFRSGLVIALDIKDSYNSNFAGDGMFVEDDQRLLYFCRNDLLKSYRLAEDDEGSTFASTSTEEQILEHFETDLFNYAFYRFAGSVLPATVAQVLAVCVERCFWGPQCGWYRGRYIDRFGQPDGVTD